MKFGANRKMSLRVLLATRLLRLAVMGSARGSCCLLFQIARGARCNENKKLAGSIASPANEIVACRYTIRKRRCLAPAAPAPRCTATCTSMPMPMPGTPIQPTPQPPQPPQPTPHRQALHPAQPRQPPHPRKPPPPHPRQPPHPPHPRASCTPLRAFSSSSKRWKVARLTSAISSSPSVIIMPGAKFGLLNIGRRYGRCQMRFLLAKKLIRRRPTPVLRFWLLASFSKLASPAAWSHPPTCCKKDIRRSDPTPTK